MARRSPMYVIIFFALFFAASCKKIDPVLLPVTPKPTPEYVGEVVEEAKPDVLPSDVTTYDLGTGSGNLTIDGQSLKIGENILVRIKGGTYKNITIKNFNLPQGKRAFIKNDGQVTIKESMRTENITNVTISGDNDPSIKYGFKFEDIAWRAITLSGKMNGVTLKSISFINVRDYAIWGDQTNGDNLNYTGTKETRNEAFKITHSLFDRSGQILFGGKLSKESNEDNGFFKDIEIAYNTFKNTDAGTVCVFTNVQDYDIHHNIVDNVNPTNNNHNGVFYMQGNGKFHHNTLTNYQGNAIRMWIYSRGNTPATSEIYHNKCYNTRKYSGFELQAFDRNMVPGKSTFSNARVYNNTVGRMNTSKDWEGQVLDLYNILGGSIEYYNNLGFDLYASNNRQPALMMNNSSNAKITKEANNKYFKTAAEAVVNVENLTSLHQGIGAQ